MSLFPAYTEGDPVGTNVQPKETTSDDPDWLTNSSYIAFKNDKTEEKEEVIVVRSEGSDSTNSDYEIQPSSSKKAKKRKKNKRREKRETSVPPPRCEFTGDEEYYVDKKASKGYLSVDKLHKPACPRYNINFPLIGQFKNRFTKSSKRYFTKIRSVLESEINLIENCTPLSEEEFALKNKEFNKTIAKNPKDIDLWINYINHQNKIPMKLTRTQLAERKMGIIEKALVHNLGSDQLYKIYVDILDSTFPSFEVSKFLDQLLSKDPTNCILWCGQILATQGSMARCVVPSVLKLYEECMQKMYRKSQEDEIMLKLFTNCSLFIRQSGLSEQFFALIKLALELNVSVDKFAQIQPHEKDQQTLIEYEEVILKSGLPMNEIWLRIEKLRQNYNVLPLPAGTKCSDPQRIVFNEDICYFIYPLSQKENCFALIIIILRLLKIPFLSISCLRNQFLFKAENLNEFDSIEETLMVFLHQTTNLIDGFSDFDLTLYELAKETACAPSFLSSNVGYEIYLNIIIEILLICAECYKDDERKRTIFVLIWLRFERILIILEKYASKLTSDYMKRIKSKVKNLLKRDENRNVMNFYTEYALIEVEFGNMHIAENIFMASISEGSSDVPNSDFCTAYVTYAEVLLKQGNSIKALKLLTCYALDIPINRLDEDILSEPKKLSALRKLTERVNDLVFIEKNVQIMELEQYFLPDYLISLIKAKTYYQVLLNAKLDAMSFLDSMLRHFMEKNPRHTFLRENIFELYLKIMQWPDKSSIVSNLLIYETISRALEEFPENLYILRACACLEGIAWYKVRRLLIKCNSPLAIIFLIASARYRFMKFRKQTLPIEGNQHPEVNTDFYSFESAYKQRVANLLKMVTDKSSPLRKNSLMWRLYLRSLSDLQVSFEQSKNILYTALDECPWNKALYLDGSVFVPQELSQLQDLIIEKQLRIYALPEELEILRNDTFEAPK